MHDKSDIQDLSYTIRENISGGWSVDTYTRESERVGTRVLCVTKRKDTTTTPKVGENEVGENDDVVCSCNSRVLSVNGDLLPV